MNDPIRRRNKVTRVCCGCMAKEGKMFEIYPGNMIDVFVKLTGLPMSSGQLCYICMHLLRKFRDFDIRCHNTFLMMRQIDSIPKEIIDSYKTTSQPSLVQSQVCFVNCDPAPTDDENKLNVAKTEPICIDVSDSDDITNLNETTKDVNEYIDMPQNNHEIYKPITESEIYMPLGDSELDMPLNEIDNVDTNIEFLDNIIDDDDFSWPEDTTSLITEESEEVEQEKIIRAKRIEELEELSHKVLKSMKRNKDCVKLKDNIYKRTRKNKNKVKVKKDDEEGETGCNTVKSPDNQAIDRVLVQDIGKLFQNIWMHDDGNIYDLIERFYAESLVEERDENVMIGLSKAEVQEKVRFLSLLDLYKQLGDIYNIDIEFRSLKQLKLEMDELRKSCRDDDQLCKLCCRKFVTTQTYERHLKKAHDASSPYKCRVCLYTFNTTGLIRQHLVRRHATKMTCRECQMNVGGGGFTNYWGRVREHEQVHRGMMKTCGYCSKDFKETHLLTMHIRKAHLAEIDALLCVLCGDTFNGRAGLNVHMHSMHKEAVQCGVCAVFFLNEESYNTHAQNGCDDELSPCSLCGENFSTAELLQKHTDENHSHVVTCRRCHKSIKKSKFHDHYSQNCAVRRNDICDPSDDKAQIDKPQPTKTHVCEVCGESFNCLANLKYHQLKHTGEKPHRCEVCDKRFRLRLQLRVHMATHTDERRYKCPVCPSAFRQAQHLKAHMPSHTLEKNYECEICHKRFTQRYSKLEHVRTIHEGQPPRQRHRKRRRAGNTE